MKRIIRYLSRSIHRKLMVSFVCIALIPLLIFGWLSYISYLNIIENMTYEYNYQMLRTFSQKLENYFTQIEQLSYTVYHENIQKIFERENDIDDFDRIRAILDIDTEFQRQMDFYNFRGVISSIIILKNDGSVFYDSTHSISVGYDFMAQEWFDSIMTRQEKSIILGPHSQNYIMGSPLGSDMQGDKYLSYIRKIGSINMADVGLGIIIINIIVNEIKKILEPLILHEDGEIIVTDNKNRRVVYYASDDRKPVDVSFKEETFNQSGYYTEKINDINYFTTYYHSDIMKWTILCRKNIRNMIKDSVKMKYTAVIMMVISFFVAVMVSVLLSYGLVNPIKKLKRIIRQARDGNLDIQVPLLSNDEIGELGSAYNEMIERIKYLIEKVLKTQLNEREAQLNALQSQINPHFLYNTLETMVSIAYEEGVEKLGGMAKSLSSMFKYSTKVGERIVTINDEITHVRNYLDIILVRYEDKFEVNLQIQDELKKYKILKFVLQPLVENSIHHGLEMKLGKGQVVIRAEEKDEIIEICVQDDGVGMSVERLTEVRRFLNESHLTTLSCSSNGRVGIKNVHERIRLYYGPEFGLSIHSEVGRGTVVTMRIPVVSD